MTLRDWQRQPNEPPRAYDAFETYFSLPVHDRSIDAAYFAANKEQIGVKKRAPTQWFTWSVQYEWVRRADAWDAHVSAERHRQFLEEATEDRKQRLVILKAARAKLRAAIVLLDPETAKWGEVFAAIRIINEQLRAEYDDVPGATPEKPIHTVEWTVEQWQRQSAQRRATVTATMGDFDDLDPTGHVDTDN